METCRAGEPGVARTRAEGERPYPDSLWRQGGDRAGQEQLGELAGQRGQEQGGKCGGRQASTSRTRMTEGRVSPDANSWTKS